MFKVFCLTKGKSLVVKCKINFLLEILIGIFYGERILITQNSIKFKVLLLKIFMSFHCLKKSFLLLSWNGFQTSYHEILPNHWQNFHLYVFYSMRCRMFLLLLLQLAAIHIYDNNNTFYSVCNRHSRFSMNKQKRKNQIHLQVLISAKIWWKKGKIKRNWNILSNNDKQKMITASQTDQE